jgi:hypothetical protein
MEEAKQRDAVHAKEKKLHLKTNGDKLLKYFSEKVAPGVHDVAGKKEGFGVWKEEWMTSRFELRENDLKSFHKEEKLEEKREKEVHRGTRSHMLLKYFSEKVAPAVHDASAKGGGLGAWKQEFLHERFGREKEFHAKRRLEQHDTHLKTRGELMVKCFSERVSPAVNDIASKKGGFGVWKEEVLNDKIRKAKQEIILKNEEFLKSEEEKQKHAETIEEQKAHSENKKNMMLAYFSEKVSPGIHDVACKNESFGIWKEEFVQKNFQKRETAKTDMLMTHMKKLGEMHGTEKTRIVELHQIHLKTKSDMLVKYFSEKVSPLVHDVAAKKESFGWWKEEFFNEKNTKETEDLRVAYWEHKRSHENLLI